ncbi:HEPN domain-containing protein [Thiocapsa rosea]|uniref:HEPN domain-containing protein n=1 Tax=Thiocapsa rosea TaxID=69360 RepID=UPI001B86F271
MADAAAVVVDAWIAKAERDLASASRLLDGTLPYPDTAVYLCQQAGEKALKAFRSLPRSAWECRPDAPRREPAGGSNRCGHAAPVTGSPTVRVRRIHPASGAGRLQSPEFAGTAD